MSQYLSSLIGLQTLPPQSTPFVGRGQELADIADLLCNPECRLLTLVGPGGIGKTRLVVRAAEETVAEFPDGIYFVALQPLQSTDFFVPAIADALMLQFSGQIEPVRQLLNFLQHKHLLLVFDNMEHLLDSASLLSEICLASPGVRCLVTSREVLNLAEEWLYPLQGLEFPDRPGRAETEEAETDIETCGAIQLFVERARRVRRDFALVDELDGVVRICRLVEGMPLALELAASWTRTMRCNAIADEIEQSLHFLATKVRNVPDRHRSMVATLDYSWQRFSPEEQEVFKRLSVFLGGFRRRAAEQVAGASLSILTALVDKSLLTWQANGRYEMHELLRQYGASKLAASPDDSRETYERHREYYVDFLEERTESIIGARQPYVLQEITDDLDNIRLAWQRTVNQANVSDIRRATYTYYEFSDFHARYREVADAFEEALVRLAHLDPCAELELTRALLQTCLGWHYIRLGQLERAQTDFEGSQQIYLKLGLDPPPGFGTDNLLGLTLLAQIAGDFAGATKLSQQAQRRHEVSGDLLNLQIAYYMLANAAFGQGEYDAAASYYQDAYRIAQQTNNLWFIAHILGDLGTVARAQGDYVQARRHYEASYSIKKQIGDPEGIALRLNQLGKIAEQENHTTEAERLHKQSLAIYRRINDRGGLASSLHGLGTVALASQQFESACNYHREALGIALDIHFLPLTLSILVDVADLMACVGQTVRGTELLALVLHHGAGDRETKDRAQEVLKRIAYELSDDTQGEIVARGRHADLGQVGTMVLTELAALGMPAQAPITPDSGRASAAGQPLIEPLTPRELEVLALMANGLTNRDIAEQLIIALGTVKSYTNQIYGKLGVQNRVQAIKRAQELALVE